ncbi:MAG: Ig-like domain-containing protein [Actinomycetota bacterium]|nr:Ig-like domain-containing protein [Actinomycetota bacterium]
MPPITRRILARALARPRKAIGPPLDSRRRRRIRLVHASVGALLALTLAAPGAPADALTPVAGTDVTLLPTSIGAMGDSISVAVSVTAAGTNSQLSWSTGGDPAVNSIRQRIQSKRGTALATTMAAAGGQGSWALETQANTIVNANVGVATILVGANDACMPYLSSMTPTATFQSRVSSALTILQNAGIKVVFASVPDLYSLWLAGKDSADAVAHWTSKGLCQSMLANPTSTAQVDVDRRSAVRQRLTEYNAAIKTECALRSVCSYDGGAVFTTSLQLSDLSTLDYFHPNISGQNKIASATWPAFTAIYPGVFGTPPDLTAPVVTITAPKSGSVVAGTVTLRAQATDNVRVTAVRFFAGTRLLGTATLSSGTWSLAYWTKNVPNGTYTVVAKAYDAAGNVGTSAAVSLVVRN